MARQTTAAIIEGIHEHVTGVDFVDETEDGGVEFTVMWGGCSDEDRAATLQGIEQFSHQYEVGVEVVSAGPEASTYRVVTSGEPVTVDVMRDVHLA